ncbi:MAG: NAD(P)-dependent oxidoreductase [Snodgrassella sp.]|nr:NAD(P)-dependent oxidoreductase [Snodgrassella sp.]
MRHIITGGSGFTGQILARKLLEAGNEVVNFDLKNYTDKELDKKSQYVYGDIRSREDIKKLNLRADDVVYHLAARQFADAVPKRNRDDWFFEVNVNGTRNILQEMVENDVTRMVFFSTDMTYGMASTCPVSTDHPQNPLGPYGRSKVEAEKLIRGYQDLNATIFRPRLITGAGRLGVLGKLFRLIALNLPVPMIGNGMNHYQMVSVEDCVSAAMLAWQKDFPRETYNLGSFQPPTTKELLQAVIKHGCSKSFVVPVPSGLIKPVLSGLDKIGLTLLYPEQFAIADQNILLDCNKTIQELGWAPSCSDIDAMCAAYDNFMNIKKNP